jgi:hypothetical protein
LNILRKLSGKNLVIYFFCFFISEILYHTRIIPEVRIHVNQV